VDELIVDYPPAHHFLRDLGAVSEQLTADRSVTVAPVSDAVRNGDSGAAIGFLATLIDVNAAMVALQASHPDWNATADLALHSTGTLSGRAAVIDSQLVRAGSNLVTVASRVHDGGAVDDPDVLLSNGASPAAIAARSVATFARIPRKASVASADFDPATMIGQRRALLAGGPPPCAPILERIGLTVLDARAGVTELHRSEYVRNSFGAINGGVLGLVFQGAAEAARPGHVATDLQIHYLSQAKEGPVRTTAEVLRSSGGHAVCSVEARDAGHDDALLAVATVGLERRRSI
jgi:acyl-coenzyme A thioesterase PaaI-like protein